MDPASAKPRSAVQKEDRKVATGALLRRQSCEGKTDSGRQMHGKSWPLEKNVDPDRAGEALVGGVRITLERGLFDTGSSIARSRFMGLHSRPIPPRRLLVRRLG